jgi:hypothetical protein
MFLSYDQVLRAEELNALDCPRMAHHFNIRLVFAKCLALLYAGIYPVIEIRH